MFGSSILSHLLRLSHLRKEPFPRLRFGLCTGSGLSFRKRLCLCVCPRSRLRLKDGACLLFAQSSAFEAGGNARVLGTQNEGLACKCAEIRFELLLNAGVS